LTDTRSLNAIYPVSGGARQAHAGVESFVLIRAPFAGAAPERISYSTGHLYLYSGNQVRRFDPTADALVLERFETAMKRGEVAEAKSLAKSLKPFTSELEVAAKINSAVGGQPFQAASQRLEAGGLPTVLAALDRASTDDKMTFYEDFKVFIEAARTDLARAGVGATEGDDRTRLATMALRVTDLSVRFERQLAGKAGEDKPVIAAIGAVASSLAESLLASGRPDDAWAGVPDGLLAAQVGPPAPDSAATTQASPRIS
jgi:hypothetical protein